MAGFDIKILRVPFVQISEGFEIIQLENAMPHDFCSVLFRVDEQKIHTELLIHEWLKLFTFCLNKNKNLTLKKSMVLSGEDFFFLRKGDCIWLEFFDCDLRKHQMLKIDFSIAIKLHNIFFSFLIDRVSNVFVGANISNVDDFQLKEELKGN